MDNETQLWAWFLFDTGFAPQRAKTLLSAWDQRGLTLRTVLELLPAKSDALGLTPEEAAKLHPPSTLPYITALRWNEPLYPVGLHQLPFKLRPALLFYTGELSLLMRPIIYLVPDPLDIKTQELLQETVGILLGENLLLATFRESQQAAILLEEMITSEGEALLFAKQGLAQLTLAKQEQALLQEGRLLILSPLPPTAPANLAWDNVLHQVAVSTAIRCVHSSAIALDKLEAEVNAPANSLLLAASPRTYAPQGIRIVTNAAEAALWLTEFPVLPANTAQKIPPQTTRVELATEPPSDPPLPPTEALYVLEKGGRVPEALKKRLFGN